MIDPLEKVIADALYRGHWNYNTPSLRRDPTGLDFRLIDENVELEVKRYYTNRMARQMQSAPNVIAIQGEVAVKFMAFLLGGIDDK